MFESFFAGGIECSTHRRHDGRRLDLIEATGHDRYPLDDYAALKNHGLRTVRDGLRWHLIEQPGGHYDWSSFLPLLRASQMSGVQVIWDLCHYGWPDFIDVWRPEFVRHFASFAAAAARIVREHSDSVPIYCPVNEISFFAWAGGDVAVMNPLARGRGLELKHQLVRASMAAVAAIREVDPRARFLHVDPLMHFVPRDPTDEAQLEHAAARLRAQYDGWLLLCGELWPGLGGQPSNLDITGVNYYSNNQWYTDGQQLMTDDPNFRPFRHLLADVHQRLGRPVFVAETGAEGAARVPWLRYVCDEVAAAREAGVPVEGICLYPVLDYPGWANERHCPTGLFGPVDAQGCRPVHDELAQELARQQARFGDHPRR